MNSKAGACGFSTPRRVYHGQHVSKQSELGRASARSSGYRFEGTELIQQRPLGFGHRCRPRTVQDVMGVPKSVLTQEGSHVCDLS
jgi:hypothetical protein